jgi:hypothetical protein
MQQSLSQVEKCILRERLGEDICNLLSSRDWQYFNDTEADMFSEVMVLDVDVLGSRSQFGNACQFERARVIFESLAVNLGLRTRDWEAVLFELVDEVHEGNGVS